MAKKIKKSPEPRIDVSIPEDLIPLIQWNRNHHYRKQKLFLESVRDNWLTLFCAANGTGKTHILYWSLVSMCLGLHPAQRDWGAKPPIKAKVLVTDFEHGLDTVAKEALFDWTYLPDGTKIGPLCPASMIKGDRMPPWNKEDKSMKFTNGSVVHFMTSEQPRRLHSGTNMDILLCDEEPYEGAYDESIRGLRTAKGGGRVLMSMTPPFFEGQGPSWTKFKIVDPWMEKKAKNYNVIRAAMAENPSITPEFIEKFSEGKTPEQIQVQVYGNYPTFGKVCFPYFQKSMWNPKTGEGNLLPYNWKVPIYEDDRVTFRFALDYHDSKPPAANWSVQQPDGDMIIYDELHPLDVDQRTVENVAGQIFQIEGDKEFSERIVRRAGDPKMKDTSNALIRGFNAWDYFRRCGIRLREGYNRDPGISYSAINEYLRGNRKNHPRLFVRENCENTIKAFENHYWMDRGVPDPKFSDYIVCVKYQVQMAKPELYKNGTRNRKNRFPLSAYEKVGWGLPRSYIERMHGANT